MQRPTGVTVTTILMCITNAMGWFIIDWHKDKAAAFTFLIFTVMILIGYAVLWFYRQGRNWARWLVMLTSLLSIWNLRTLSHPIPNVTALNRIMVISEAAIGLYLLVYLNTPRIRAWFNTPGS